MRNIVDDAVRIKRIDHGPAEIGERPAIMIAAGVARAGRPRQANDPQPAREPLLDIVGRANRVGALHQNHDARLRPVTFEIASAAHQPQLAVALQLLIALDLTKPDCLRSLQIIVAGVSVRAIASIMIAHFIEPHLREDRGEDPAHACAPQCRQRDASSLCITGIAANVAAVHREIREIKMAIAPGDAGGHGRMVGIRDTPPESLRCAASNV